MTLQTNVNLRENGFKPEVQHLNSGNFATLTALYSKLQSEDRIAIASFL